MNETSAPPVVKEFLPENGIVFNKTPSKKTNKQKCKARGTADGVHCSMRPVLVVAQCIGLLPINGIFGADHRHLRYSKYSIKTAVSFFLICSCSCLAMLTLMLTWREGITYRVAGDIMFYSSSSLSMIAFFKLAKKWRTLMQKWAVVEEVMANMPPVRVSRFIAVLTSYVVIASVCEHTMAVLYNRNPCHIGWKRYYTDSFRQIFAMTDYAIWKGLLMSALNFVMASTWNFTDLFLVSIAMSLSARFRQFNLELDSVIHKDMNEAYWKRIRETYNKLALLTKLVDENVSLLILISFTNNLYFICLQLLYSIKPVDSLSKTIYLIISFSHLLFRACSVSLAAAEVHDKSKAPIATLFSVPSSSYNTEVQRMILQVALENLALTGCKFFSVTRTLMLTPKTTPSIEFPLEKPLYDVAGTIATYEIVLVQFSQLSPDNNNQSIVLNCAEEQ